MSTYRENTTEKAKNDISNYLVTYTISDTMRADTQPPSQIV